jgi:hypothetical protein
VSKLWVSENNKKKKLISTSTFVNLENRKSLKEAGNNTKIRVAKQAAADIYRETYTGQNEHKMCQTRVVQLNGLGS